MKINVIESLSTFSANFSRYLRLKIKLDGLGNGIGKSEKIQFSGIGLILKNLKKIECARELLPDFSIWTRLEVDTWLDREYLVWSVLLVYNKPKLWLQIC